MSVKPGDRVRITKPAHPARGRTGVVLGWEKLDDGTPVAYVAGADPHDGKAWPVFVLRPGDVELIARCDSGASAALIESIIDACEARGCPLRGIYSWAGPYRPRGTHAP